MNQAPIAAPMPIRLCFFHQNGVFGVQGGIERYIATLIGSAPDTTALVSPQLSQTIPHPIAVKPRGPSPAPLWLRYVAGVIAQRREIAENLRAINAQTLEFSRPEYALIAWMFSGRRTFTIHGTGPGPGHRLHRFLHAVCCWLLLLLADRVQVIGRDPSGLPRGVVKRLGARLVYVDAWYAECFKPSPLPPLTKDRPLRVFYAGRLAPQKNPRLLFAIIREAARQAPGVFEFHYFGSDFADFMHAGLGDMAINHGLLGPQALAQAIGQCHMGLLCSTYGEGSPYIVTETLACGRPFVVSALPTLRASYHDFTSVFQVESQAPADYVQAMFSARDALRTNKLTPEIIAAQIAPRAQSPAAPNLVAALLDLARLQQSPAQC